MFIGHRRDDGCEQPLKEHLCSVASLAAEFARPFDASDHARRTGLLHDAGKYSAAGQRRMRYPDQVAKVDHTSAGAQIAFKQFRDGMGASAIAGHHGGLLDFGNRGSAAGDGTLISRLAKKLEGDLNYGAFWSENQVEGKMVFPKWLSANAPFEIQFYTRMLFSTLVDADFLDTEAFMSEEQPVRGICESVEVLRDKLNKKVQEWIQHPKNELDVARNTILLDCQKAAQKEQGIYTLTVPTGGGKTVSSLMFALEHAARHGLKRIIYVIPYTSIIEQTASVFGDILGEENVLEHHSNVDYDSVGDMEDTSVMRRMLATENWDATVIVTTAVQFFESLYANKPSRCRKLHNIAQSVIIFDEAQMLPVHYLNACVYAIAELVRHYRVTAVLCTATQPSLNGILQSYVRNLQPVEICANVDRLQSVFRRTTFVQRGHIQEETLAMELSERDQVLCIVNTRTEAQDIFGRLPEEGRFHLSTRMTPEHRTEVLRKIRCRLHDGETCRVVSTSLLEAGVDVDFPEVWREMAGLDSIMQAAGRCNREGKRRLEDSKVYVFTIPEGIPRGMRQNAAATEMAMEVGLPMDDPHTVKLYFDRLLEMIGEGTDSREIIDTCNRMMFKTTAERFHLIDDDSSTVYIPTKDNTELLEQLKAGRISRRILRRLNRYAVNLNAWDWKTLYDQGRIEMEGESVGILKDAAVYDSECGLLVNQEQGRALWG